MEEMRHDEKKKREEIFSKAIKAGRRMYFFDIKSTRENDLYLTITESKKKFEGDEGRFHFEKHKLFLYKEDFQKFSEALNAMIEFAKTRLKPESQITAVSPAETIADATFEEVKEKPPVVSETVPESFADITFEDLKDESQVNEEEKLN
jgi:hypothetical protein